MKLAHIIKVHKANIDKSEDKLRNPALSTN